jgi:hypothetical protein
MSSLPELTTLSYLLICAALFMTGLAATAMCAVIRIAVDVRHFIERKDQTP